jgi:hypothetical protein
MFPFWATVTEPILRLQRPKVIVEIGSEAGHNLKNLLVFATQHDAAVYAIDPKPLFDVAQWVAHFNGRLTVHAAPSLEALPRLDAFDVIFIDGDHNWYTVFHELKAIEQRTAELGRPFPLVLLHDIGWPWGRRDLYYAPEAIPAGFRQPYGQPQSPPGNPNYHADYCRAVHEGGPRNGVLTAVEDFLARTSEPLELIKLPGFAGLGIVLPKWLAQANPELAAFIRGLDPPPALRRYIEDLESYRMRRRR